MDREVFRVSCPVLLYAFALFVLALVCLCWFWYWLLTLNATATLRSMSIPIDTGIIDYRYAFFFLFVTRISAKISLLLIYIIATSSLRSACGAFTRPGTPLAPQPILVRCAFAPNAIYGDKPSKKAEIKKKKSDIDFFERHPGWDWRGSQLRSDGWSHEMWAH